MDINITIEVKNIEPEQATSLLASIEQVEQQAKKKRGRPRKYSDEERKARRKAYLKEWYIKNRDKQLAKQKEYDDAHREQVRASNRLCSDRRRNSHIKGYVPTSEYKRGWSIKDSTDKGYLYLAHDRDTGALKIGCTMCNPQNRLSYYKSHDNEGITFLKVSPLLNDVYNAESAAHAMLRENVRPVTTANKFKTSTNPSAEWFQMNGKFTIADILRVFDTVSNQFACNKETNE